MFGLSYLPTAQRLSFNIIKGINLKHSCIDINLEHFNPFVRILQVNSSGKVVKRKKTNFSCEPSQVNPVFDETIIFELAPSQVEQMTFVLMVATKNSDPIQVSQWMSQANI